MKETPVVQKITLTALGVFAIVTFIIWAFTSLLIVFAGVSPIF